MLNKELTTKSAMSAVAVIAFVAIIIISIYSQKDDDKISDFGSGKIGFSRGSDIKLENFKSEEEFKAYLETVSARDYYGRALKSVEETRDVSGPIPTPLTSDRAAGGAGEPVRVSTTNVQVAGIDEPDIVKTDGKQIYFSPEAFYRYGFRGGITFEESESIISFPPPQTGKSLSIKAFPPADLEISARIDKLGSMLLTEDILIVFSNNNEITAYDVSKPDSPKEKWDLKLDKSNYIVQARLFDGKIYLVTQQYLNFTRPCPVPLFEGRGSITVPCDDIYYPLVPISADVTMSAVVLDPKDGEIENTVSLVGSSGTSVVYMSENAIYATYQYKESVVKFSVKFLNEKFSDVAPAWLIDKVSKLDSYDISETSKMAELQFLWNQYTNSLDDDERLRVTNELANRLKDYYKDNLRDIEQTAIVKIGVDDFSIDALGSVPGRLLNQFAMDEYENNLRVATTVGEQFGFDIFGIWDAGRESENDVYVLGKDLKIKGSVKGLGLTEKIYSARFIEDKGYLVTFRQIDPFYVLDLSDPEKPEMKGELKIPGFSSYLHPVNENFIAGIGRDGSQVKVSLFDVSSPENPTEAAKYALSEYWTDVENTHHAFLMDKKHEIFFIPGGRGGYVFSYKDNNLSLVRVVSNIQARRAIFINDYLYIVGEDKIIVLNEADWEKVNELELR